MVPTLGGRLQTRLFVLLIVGGLVTLLVTPLLPGDTPVGRSYKATFTVLIAVTTAGLLWEFIYHFFQQFRWEKDWPTLFGLVTGVNEGLIIWWVLSSGAIPTENNISALDFFFHFTSVWLVTWIWVNGPMRVPFIRWRFRGGRLV